MAKEKMRLSDILMNFVAPAGAMIASTYGPRWSGAAAIGMSAVNNLQENKRRQKLGKEVARLADVRADADLEARTKTYNKTMDVATKLLPSEAAAAAALQGFGIQNPVGTGEVKKQRTMDFVNAMPAPVRDEAFDLVGSVAIGGDPEGAISMLRDDDRLKQQLAMKAAENIYRTEKDRMDRDVRSSEMRLNSHLAEAEAEKTAEYRTAMLAGKDADRKADVRQGDLDRQVRQNQIDAIQSSKDYDTKVGRIRSLEKGINDNRVKLRQDMWSEEEIDSVLREQTDQLHMLQADLYGADSIISLADLVAGGGPQPGQAPGLENTEVSAHPGLTARGQGLLDGTAQPGQPQVQPDAATAAVQADVAADDVAVLRASRQPQQMVSDLVSAMTKHGSQNAEAIIAEMAGFGYTEADVEKAWQLRQSMAADPMITPQGVGQAGMRLLDMLPTSPRANR